MSSQSKRRAESDEDSHKKKPRKGEGEEEFKQGEDKGLEAEDGQDDVGALDKDNTIPVDITTRGKRVDYTKVGLDDDSGFEARKEVSEEKKGVPTGPGARSPQRVLVEDAEEDEEYDDDDEEEGEYGEDEDDDDADDYEEDEEE